MWTISFISYKNENPVQRIIVAEGEQLLPAFYERINPIVTAVELLQACF